MTKILVIKKSDFHFTFNGAGLRGSDHAKLGTKNFHTEVPESLV
jgi:hypothetical protein